MTRNWARYGAMGAFAAFACLAAGGSAAAADRHVDIINHTKHTIVKFYASNTGSNDWEEDILGKDTLDPGETVNIDIDDGTGKCHFDFKAVFNDGDAVVKHNINVCEIESYEYTE